MVLYFSFRDYSVRITAEPVVPNAMPMEALAFYLDHVTHV
jgi:hypothetical protein